MPATFWGQFKALVRKNVTIKRRSLNQSLQEFLYPIYFSVILAVIKNTTKADTFSEIPSFPAYSISNQSYFTYDFSKTVYVAPDDVDTQTFANNSLAILESMVNSSKIDVKYFPSEADMLSGYNANKGTVNVGIIFKYKGGQLYDYAIRTPSYNTPDTTSYTRKQSQCRQGVGLDNDNTQCAVNSYIHSGFSVIQTAINTAWIRREMNSASFPTPSVSVQMMPKPTFTPDTSYLQTISAIYFVIAYSPFVNFLTMNLVSEKEKKIKENMKMMGLQDSAFWLSWASVYFVIILIVTVVITLISLVSQFFPNSNSFIFFLILFLYGLSILTLSCVTSTFFSKAQVAGGLSGLATMVISCLYLVVSLTKTVLPSGAVVYSVSPGVRWLLCLISPIAVALAIDQAIYLDQPLNGGMNFTSITYGDFPLWAPMVMLLVDCVLYFFLAVYLDNVVPGEYGPKHKPWYFLLKSYWFAKSEEKMKLLRERAYTEEWGENVEPVSSEVQLKTAIKVSDLRKEFKTDEKTVQAVNHLSLEMYEGQITCLLGHNGAGKTTLINILTGLLPATGGRATVMGYDVTNTVEMAEIRKMTGVCSQTNVIFEELTAWEHLVLYGGIKGVPDSDINQQCETSLKTVDLYKEKDTRSKNLSGGQKRKLCVAMALIGDPKVIFLDEPTAGMDPYSRRHLWSILKQKKKNKVILLTTHFMDEADILADRKAFISKGKLRCCGSSLFLKSKFGIGYHLNMVVNPDCDTDRVTKVVKDSVSGAELQRVHGKELAYTLPLNQVNNFSGLFTIFEDEDKSRSLGIKTFGVAMTTLEEVFLKLEEDNEDLEIGEIIGSGNSKRSESYGSFNVANPNQSLNNVELTLDPTENLTLVTDESELASMQFWSLAKVRVLRFLRIRPAVIFSLILPVIFVVVGLLVSKYVSPPSGDTTPVPMQMSVAARQYAHAVGGSSSTDPFLTKDAVDTVDSRLFMDFLKTQFTTETYQFANSTLLSSEHQLGLDLTSFTKTGQMFTSAFTALYNDSSIHSIPAIINLFSNTLLMTAANLTATNFTQLNAYALPWPADLKTGAYDQSAFSASILIAMAFITVCPGFGVDLVKDRQFKIRGQLRVSGVTSLMYWTTNFVVDVVKFLIPAVLMFIVILAFQVESLKSGGALFALVLLFLAVIPSSISFAYVFSFAFTKFETYQAVILIFYMFAAFIPYMAVSMVDMFGFYSTASIIHYICLVIINPYHVFGGIYFITRVYSRQLLMGKGNEDIPFSDYFSAPIVMSFVMPVIHAFFWFFMLRVLDIKVTGGDISEALPWKSKQTKVIPLENNDVIEDEDDDVSKERERVTSLSPTDQSIAGYIENLRKEFKKTEKKKSCRNVPAEEKIKIAVRNATFAVDTGEIFGLLGPNGAGKTTTLNMMIAEVGPTKGKVVVGGYDIRSCMSDAFKALGYCPQHDALWDVITLQEQIECYAKIRGIPKEDVKLVTDFYMNNIKITEHAKKHAKKLSGGTKRKLSYIMSIISGPKILLLDEPSTGMDPKSKRFLWDTISSNVNGTDRGAILTTHYMEEADALCSRLAIMVNGKIECIGATQHLKGKFGSGYLLEVKLSITGNEADEEIEQKMDALEEHLDALFPDTTPLERFGERAQYKVKKESIKSLSHTFISLEQAKTEYGMEEYNFSQSTLEQVFLEFAKEQMDEDERKERAEAAKRNPARQLSRTSNSIRL